jgi:hypothetical protein
MENDLSRRVLRLERELLIWRFGAFALAMVFLSGAALEKRTQLQELRLISEDSKYATILRPDGMRLFAGDKLLGSITSRDQGEFGLTAEVELTDPRATVVKLATYGLTLGTGSDRTTVTSFRADSFVVRHGADRIGRVSLGAVQRHAWIENFTDGW